MSYSLYITRRKRWYDEESPAIDLTEWVTLVESDPELSFDPSLGEHYAVWSGNSKHDVPCISWASGNLESNRPDDALIEKMIQVALMLGARVIGEEGEIYAGAQSVLSPPPPGIVERLKGWLYVARAMLSSQAEATDLEFKVGSRVKGFRGRLGTVTSIDLKAERGLGVITVKYDDGRLEQCAAFAHGLEAVEGGI
jgi:hypothetical protein